MATLTTELPAMLYSSANFSKSSSETTISEQSLHLPEKKDRFVGKGKNKHFSTEKANPFRCAEKHMFLYEEQQLKDREKDSLALQHLKAREKCNYASRMKTRNRKNTVILGSRFKCQSSVVDKGQDSAFILSLRKCCEEEKKSISEYITEQKHRFFMEYELGVKRQAIKDLEKAMIQKEEEFKLAEKKLLKNEVAFEEFLRENDKKSEDALKIVGQEIKAKLRVTAELKTATDEVVAMKKEISSNDEFDLSLDDIGNDLEPKIYFQNPEELLHIFSKLEEQNLNLIQHSQDMAESFEEFQRTEKNMKEKIKQNIAVLVEEKEILKLSCIKEEEKAAELALRSSLFSFGEFNLETQDKMLQMLSKKVTEVFKSCVGEPKAYNLNTIQMLMKIEHRLEELSDLLESVPKETIELIERPKRREKRNKLREEKLKQKQLLQEAKLKIALERAVAEPTKKLGRRLVFRSQPPRQVKKESAHEESKPEELEEYFFT
ncbi:coiled-coil domain-containing protein 38 isoform X3 [Ornithorhynchus anatinus]|uniref:coiled-coil domain-containing protein 38 isoform X3 n=1 Tax=Ornithorhynchus anatinus TaxID=9258 RepID=UPI0010A8A5AD|nr:coiled-coil domain-containing protein 38 isoform X3 [Ornithorhynchus anatinus]